MDIEIAKMSRMAERGSSLLRLIQNSHTPILDLLIRESIQNSLDAARDPKDPIKYDISIKEFEKSNASKHFEGIEENLQARFENEKQKSVVIRDSSTTGLTGPIHHDYIRDNKYGNLLKLVYEISMPQEKKEAGGSWGLGKTVYFRVGIGLVIYYSRVKLENGEFQPRLAACLVENENKKDALLPIDEGTPKRGIAWWGETHSEGSTKPLTDEGQINKFLRDFNVTPYEEEETGTTIIIPFVDTSKIIAKRDYEQGQLWWHKNINYYLEMAIQRWYAPRIDNQFYKYGNYLAPSVNNKSINKENMEPIFSIIRSLYISAQHEKVNENFKFIHEKDITVKEIKIHRDLKSNVAGKVSFIKVNRDHLKMNVPDNKKSPYEFLDLSKYSDGNNSPIVTYLRKPGMIVNFETEGKWTNGIEKTPSDEYIVGIFVPDSENIVVLSQDKISLDEYLRQGEKADHSSWSDITLDDKKFTIVERIQKRVSGSIKDAYNENVDDNKTTRSGALSKSLAQSLLPPIGFGKSPGIPGGKNPGGEVISKRNQSGKLQITSTSRTDNGLLVLEFGMSVPKKAKSMVIEIQIESEGNKKIKGDEWEKDEVIGTKFPIEIEKVSLNENIQNQGKLDIKLQRTKKFNVSNIINIEFNGFEDKIEGKIYLANYDSMVQASIRHDIEVVKESRV